AGNNTIVAYQSLGRPYPWNNANAGSWAFQILPYAEQDQVYKGGGATTLAAQQTRAANALIPIYFCPSRRAPTTLASTGRGGFDYYGNGQNYPGGNYGGCPSSIRYEGVFRPHCTGRITMVGITDGTSNTIGVAEKNVCLRLL